MSIADTAPKADTADTFPQDSDESEMLRLCKRGRIGSARVRPHKQKYWELDFAHPGGSHLPRRRRYCKSPTEAVREARRITQELREHGALAMSLSSGQRWAAAQCFSRIATLYDADPAHLIRIVDEHMRRHPLGANAKTLDQVRVELIARKTKIGRSERHVKGLDYKLRTLIAALGNKRVTLVTTRDLENELERHPTWKPTTVHSTTQGWKVLFNFARKQGYVVENPCEKLELPAIVRDEPRILSVYEAKRLMAATLFADLHPLLVGYLVQESEDGGLLSVLQNVHEGALLHVGDHATVAAQCVDLVEAHPFGRLDVEARQLTLRVAVEDAAHRAVGHTEVAGQVREGGLQGLLLDLGNQPLRHHELVVHLGQREDVGLAAQLAVEALAIDLDHDVPAVHPEVVVGDRLAPVLNERLSAARRWRAVHLDTENVTLGVGFVARRDGDAWQVEHRRAG